MFTAIAKALAITLVFAAVVYASLVFPWHPSLLTTEVLGAIVAGVIALRLGMRAVRLPTSGIGSDASGVVELRGVARAADGCLLHDPIGHRPCVWFAVKSFEGKVTLSSSATPASAWAWRGREKAPFFKQAASGRRFVVVDATGSCLVDPAGAEMDFGEPDIHYDKAGDATHAVWRIYAGTRLSIWGSFSRNGGERCVSAPSDGSRYVISRDSPKEYERSKIALGAIAWLVAALVVIFSLLKMFNDQVRWL